jgi:COP9 signalosome complex subunit 7
VDATLDPAHETIYIHSVAPLRDVDPAAIPDLLSSLKAWASRCEAALENLEGRVKTIRAAADVRAQSQAEWDARVSKLVEDEGKASGQHGAPQFDLAGAGAHGHGPGHGLAQHGFGSGAGLPARGPAGSSGQGRAMRSFMKRGSGHMDAGAQDVVDDEAMDLDEEDEVGEKKRSSRRKLLG